MHLTALDASIKYAMKIVADSDHLNRDLSIMMKDIRVYRLYTSISDHAQMSCDVLKEGDRLYLKHSWLIILPKLENKERLLTA